MSIEQPDDALSSNNLGTEIWESNSSGIRQTPLCVSALFLMFFFAETETKETLSV